MDTQVELESCGGCLFGGSSSVGQDCTAIEGALGVVSPDRCLISSGLKNISLPRPASKDVARSAAASLDLHLSMANASEGR